jgi:hypothetical protein
MGVNFNAITYIASDEMLLQVKRFVAKDPEAP